MARVALELDLCSAARRSDLVELGPQHIRQGTLTYTQQKTGVTVTIPVLSELAEALATIPTLPYRRERYAAAVPRTEAGAEFSPGTFGNKFRQWVREAGLPAHCSVHGLRHAAARRLAEAGCSPHEIQAHTGHRTLRQIEHYTKDADSKRLARTASQRLVEAFPTDQSRNSFGKPS